MPSVTRKKRHLTEKLIRSKLTVSNYDTYLDKNVYFGEDPFKLPADDEWDPKTGTCAMHALFTIESLGAKLTNKIKQYRGFKEVNKTNIEMILNKLDHGSILEFAHTYRDKTILNRLPKNNLYGSHDFIIVKGSDKYFLSQGFQFEYKHLLTSYSREEISEMLNDIVTYVCDYENSRHWKDLKLEYYKKYFKAPLLVGGIKMLYPKPAAKVHNVVLEYLEIKV